MHILVKFQNLISTTRIICEERRYKFRICTRAIRNGTNDGAAEVFRSSLLSKKFCETIRYCIYLVTKVCFLPYNIETNTTIEFFFIEYYDFTIIQFVVSFE